MLTDSKVKGLKPGPVPYKRYDAEGLFIRVSPTGGKLWRFRYRFDGKAKLLSFGRYPYISLKQARERREDARRELARGVDPSRERRAIKEAVKNTLEAVSREWYAKHAPRWAPSHAVRVGRRLERDVFPWLGARPIAELTPIDILPCMRRIERRGAGNTAHRTLQTLSAVFRYAVATGRCPHDITADLRGALAPVAKEHFATVTEPAAVGGLLRSLWGYQGTFPVVCALRLAPYLFVRPGELRHAEWSEIDLDAAAWNIPAPKMKVREPHIVPLSRQAVDILQDLCPLTGHGRYVFPSARSDHRPMSENACLAAMRNSGIAKEEMVVHGWRATARTLLHEVLGFPAEVIEAQLAHRPAGSLGSAYNRTKFREERIRMMQAWADYLDTLRRGG